MPNLVGDSSDPNVAAVLGTNTAATTSGGLGDGAGVMGVSASTSGTGVLGQADGDSALGVVGLSAGTSGIGVLGQADGDSALGVLGRSANNVGVEGDSEGNDGVRGTTRAPASTYAGVRGVNTSNGTGVVGEAVAGDGVFGNTTGGRGVVGHSANGAGVAGASDNSDGVFGSTNSGTVGGAGVWGSNAGTGYGVKGTGGTGVHGEGGGFAGVEGKATGTSLYGVYGEVSDGLAGVFGYNTGLQSAPGVEGDGGSNGEGVSGRGFKGPGVTGFSNQGPAGYFVGDVNVSGTITILGDIIQAALANDLRLIFEELSACCGFGGGGGGNFLIDHPLDPDNKLLSHAAVKSPDVKNVYDGVVIVDANGEATVQLPSWFMALNSDVRYQLTPVGAAAPNLHVAQKVAGNSFKIAGGAQGMEVCWQVTGIRQDPWVKANPFIVEQSKTEPERGYYVHPEVFHQPADKDIRLVRNPDAMRRLSELQNEPGATQTLLQQKRDTALEERLKQPRPTRRA